MTTTKIELTGRETRQDWVLLALAIVIAITAYRPVIHATHHHFFLEPDSVGYLSLGENIFRGKGFVDFSGDWCSDWPPFFPFVIGIFQLLLHDQLLALGAMGALNLSLTLGFAYACLKKVTASTAIQLSVVSALAFSAPLTNLANSALSESLFIPLTLACIYVTGISIESKKLAPFILSAAAALLCCLTRYIGTAVVAAVVVSFLCTRRLPIKKRISDSVFYSMISLIPLFAWSLLNKHYTGTFMGEREYGDHTFRECFIALGGCVENWLDIPWLPALLTFVALVGAAVWFCSRREHSLPHVSVALLFLLIYGGMMIWSSARYNIDMVDDRLAAPLFVPFVIVVVGLIEPIRCALAKPIAISFAACISALFIAALLISTNLPQIPTGGYLSAIWQHSPTLAYVSKTAFDQPLQSNDSAATYLLGHKEADWVADDTDSPTMDYVESQLIQVPDRSYVIWLDNAIEPDNFDPEVIAARCHMRIIGRFTDGVIFQRNQDSFQDKAGR